MRKTTIATAAFALGSLTAVAVAQSPSRERFGHFYRLSPRQVAGRTVWPRVNDTLDIARLPDGNAFVKLDAAIGDQSCSFAGIARFEGAEFVYQDLQAAPEQACRIVFEHDGGRISWTANAHCRARCPGGGLTGSLPATHRIKGQPAARLAGYTEALAEWRASLPHGL